jgi:hypothetical protein
MAAQAFPIEDPHSELKIVIVCEDLQSGKEAKELQDQLGLSLESKVALVPEAWTFRALKDPALQELATQETAAADMIILSTRSNAELPQWLRGWLESRLNEQDGPKALVALLGSAQATPQARATRLYFEDVAARSRVDFFVQREASSEC